MILYDAHDQRALAHTGIAGHDDAECARRFLKRALLYTFIMIKYGSHTVVVTLRTAGVCDVSLLYGERMSADVCM